MTDSETSAIYSVLRGLDGVDEKTLKRPEVAYLSSVLEDGELPEWVLGSPPPNVAVATDRRIIYMSTPILGNKIKHASYAYHDILEVGHSMGMCIISTTDKKRVVVNASKDEAEAFIAFVNPKIAEHRDSESVNALSPAPASLPDDSVTASGTSPIYSVLRGLNGVDEKTMERPAVAYLPSVLEDGEIPECVLDGRPPDFVVATDRRIIHMTKSTFTDKIKKHASYPYHEVFSVKRSVGMCIIDTAEKTIHINAPRGKTESFIAFVKPKIAEHRDTKLIDLYDKMKETIPLEVLANETTGRLLSLLEENSSILKEGEVPIQITTGTYNLGSALFEKNVSGFLVATDRRVILVNESFVKDFNYAMITSIKANRGVRFGRITIYIAGSKEEIRYVPNEQAPLFAGAVWSKVEELKKQSQAPSPPTPAPASVADELLKFSELLEKGLISQEEFDAQKAKLLAS